MEQKLQTLESLDQLHIVLLPVDSGELQSGEETKSAPDVESNEACPLNSDERQSAEEDLLTLPVTSDGRGAGEADDLHSGEVLQIMPSASSDVLAQGSSASDDLQCETTPQTEVGPK